MSSYYETTHSIQVSFQPKYLFKPKGSIQIILAWNYYHLAITIKLNPKN